MTFSGNLLYFPRFMTMYFADVGVWQFMMGHKWLLKKAATHCVNAPKKKIKKNFIKPSYDITSSSGEMKLY